MQALARALSDWSQTDGGIAMLNRAADLTPTDFEIGGLKRKIDTMMQDDESTPTYAYKLPRTFVFEPSAQEGALLDTSADDLIDLTAFGLWAHISVGNVQIVTIVMFSFCLFGRLSLLL